MNTFDIRCRYLGWAEIALRAANPDLCDLRLSAQSHYGPPNQLAFILVLGAHGDPIRQKSIAAEANKLLEQLGCAVVLEPGRDVYSVKPRRPASAHEHIRMMSNLRDALRHSGEGQ